MQASSIPHGFSLASLLLKMDSSCKVLGDTTMAAWTYSGARDKDDSRVAAVVVCSRSRLRGGVSDEWLLVCCCSVSGHQWREGCLGTLQWLSKSILSRGAGTNLVRCWKLTVVAAFFAVPTCALFMATTHSGGWCRSTWTVILQRGEFDGGGAMAASGDYEGWWLRIKIKVFVWRWRWWRGNMLLAQIL